MSRAGHPEQIVRSRLRQAHELSQDPLATLTDLAKTWGVSPPAASNYLKKYDCDLRDEFRTRQVLGNQFNRQDALWRLKFVKSQCDSGVPMVKISKRLGISQSGLVQWLERWASDDLEQAIADLEDYDENLLCAS